MAQRFLSDINLGDNIYLRFGDANDLRIYHDGSYSRIVENGTGHLIIQGTNLDLASTPTGDPFLKAYTNRSVELLGILLIKNHASVYFGGP